MAARPLLAACNVTRRAADGKLLLRGVSLAVAAGERHTVCGPNGAGKTLLLRLLALLDEPDGGEVRWRGACVADDQVPAFRRQVAYVAQRPVLIEGTGEENLRLPDRFAAAPPAPFDRRVAAAALERLGFDDGLLERSGESLSGGEMQALALLRALRTAPRILLLDEPTAAAAPAAARAMEDYVLAWQQQEPERRAFIWVTHDSAQARRLGARTSRLEQGRLLEPGPQVDATPTPAAARKPPGPAAGGADAG